MLAMTPPRHCERSEAIQSIKQPTQPARRSAAFNELPRARSAGYQKTGTVCRLLFRIDLPDRRAMLAMTPPSLRAQRSNPVNQTTGAADAAIQPPLSKMPFNSTGSPRCARDDRPLVDHRAMLAMTSPVIASAAKQSSQSNNRRSRRGNPAAFIQNAF